VVVPTSRTIVSPLGDHRAAARAMARFCAAAATSASSKGRSAGAALRGTAPPRTRRSRPAGLERVEVAADRDLGDLEALGQVGDADEVALAQQRQHPVAADAGGDRVSLAVIAGS
jgi:hypothetical protein